MGPRYAGNGTADNDMDADDLPAGNGSADGHASSVPSNAVEVTDTGYMDADDLPAGNGSADGHADCVP